MPAGWRCSQNHCFDRSKEGYVNLLLNTHKKSAEPGDSKQMIRSRRNFLDAGYYQPLRAALVELLRMHLPQHSTRICDVGCGEGFFTSACSEGTPDSVSVHGLDISKEAIRLAARRYRQCAFCVASSYRMPYPDGSMDAFVRVMAPSISEELRRVLRPEGIVITVTPAPRHLYQFKYELFDGASVHLHDSEPERVDGLQLVAAEQLSFEMELEREHLPSLLQMTPLGWMAPAEALERVTVAEGILKCEADFWLCVHKPK